MTRVVPRVLVVGVSLSLCVHAFLLALPASLAFWTLLLTAVAAASCLYFLRPAAADAATLEAQNDLEKRSEALQTQITQFEETRTALLAEFDQRSGRLNEREHLLAARFARFQEFLEYPIDDPHESRSTAELHQLSDNDRKVRQLLETEAERVYEKIRRNGYSVNGKVDVFAIRDEAHLLFKQVAQIYKPDAENPLLETSFEQLARAASRVCLHVLVLLEQLPVNVQQYNISTLYGYFQKAVTGYGMYQKAGPWLSYLSRGLYAGRIASATNPATIGAWWLATEIGKRGASKLIENVVDRQAVAVLHQLIAVIGVEAASIYGTGFRQRDPAWILGTELVELIHSFPPSGESLRSGMKRITGLPLKNEYDRIYLYRCLADHRSAGRHIADSAMLTRDQREDIARQLEQFFVDHIHGASAATVQKWRDGAERRLDLKLSLQDVSSAPKASVRKSAESAVASLSGFLASFLSIPVGQKIDVLRSLKSFQFLDVPAQDVAAQRLAIESDSLTFEPPELDPASETTTSFLHDIVTCATSGDRPDQQIEQLVAETFGYFRHTTAEARQWLDQSWRNRLRQNSAPDVAIESLPTGAARAFFEHREDNEQLVFCYEGVNALSGDSLAAIDQSVLMGCSIQQDGAASTRRLMVVSIDQSHLLWTAVPPMTVQRRSGILVDAAEVTGGQWADAIVKEKRLAPTAALVIEGSLRGGRYKNYFRPLLDFVGQ